MFNKSLSNKDDSLTTNIPGLGMCRIVLSCRNAESLIKAIKETTSKLDTIDKDIANKVVEQIKKAAQELNEQNLPTYINKFKDLDKYYDNLKLVKNEILSIDTSVNIPVTVYTTAGHIVKEGKGTIKSVNIGSKTVAIEYIGADNKKNTYKVEISQLCIQGTDCIVSIGQQKQTGGAGGSGGAGGAGSAGKYGGEPSDKNYVVICE
jgi:hypothetical protein